MLVTISDNLRGEFLANPRDFYKFLKVGGINISDSIGGSDLLGNFTLYTKKSNKASDENKEPNKNEHFAFVGGEGEHILFLSIILKISLYVIMATN